MLPGPLPDFGIDSGGGAITPDVSGGNAESGDAFSETGASTAGGGDIVLSSGGSSAGSGRPDNANMALVVGVAVAIAVVAGFAVRR